jgi:hypothetical protein
MFSVSRISRAEAPVTQMGLPRSNSLARSSGPTMTGPKTQVSDEIGYNSQGLFVVTRDGHTDPLAITHRVRKHAGTERVERLHESNTRKVPGHGQARSPSPATPP